jgi:hypothetical protein
VHPSGCKAETLAFAYRYEGSKKIGRKIHLENQ